MAYICSTCEVGYYHEGNTCRLCNDACATCTGSYINECNSCVGEYYLDETTCTLCNDGCTNCIGVDIVEESWTNWDSLAFSFTTYCNTPICDGWVLGSQSISSPDVLEDDMNAYLETSITLSEPGSLIFTASVSSEYTYDGLIVNVDYIRSLGLISGEVPSTEYSIDLDAGNHYIQFIYAKDFAVSEGSDNAIITVCIFFLI